MYKCLLLVCIGLGLASCNQQKNDSEVSAFAITAISIRITATPTLAGFVPKVILMRIGGDARKTFTSLGTYTVRVYPGDYRIFTNGNINYGGIKFVPTVDKSVFTVKDGEKIVVNVKYIGKDTESPTVNLTSDKIEYIPGDIARFSAIADDNIGVIKVEFYEEGILKATDNTAPYEYKRTFDTSDSGKKLNYVAKAYDSDGNIGVSSALMIYVKSIKFTEHSTGLSGFVYGMAADSDNNMWFVETIANRIGKIDPSGKITEYLIPTPNSGSLNIQQGIGGNMWFVENYANQIAKIDKLDTITEYPIPTPASDTYRMIQGLDGNMWFSEENASQIGKITDLGVITEYQTPTLDSEPGTIAQGDDGNIWFVEYNANRIGKIDPSGKITEYLIPTPNSGTYKMTKGSDKNMWFIERNANKIGKIDRFGSIIEYPIPTKDSETTFISLGSDGDMWFVENKANKIGKISPSGMIEEYLIPSSRGGISNFVTTKDKNMWFIETYDKKLAKLNPDGSIFEYSIPISDFQPYFDPVGSPDGALWITNHDHDPAPKIIKIEFS